MLLEFACSNHKSIRDEICISMVAPPDSYGEDQVWREDGLDVLRTAAIYGANGSGKSNLVDALWFVRKLVVESGTYQPGKDIRQSPHKMDGYDKESTYRIEFTTVDKRYLYGFSVRRMKIVDEYLYDFPDGERTLVFRRNEDNFVVCRQGSTWFADSQGSAWFVNCEVYPNRLFLSSAAFYTPIPEVRDAYMFFNEELCVYREPNLKRSLYMIQHNHTIKDAVLSFFSEIGMPVGDIRVNGPLADLNVSLVYPPVQIDLIGEESDGMRQIIALLGPVFDTLINGKVLVYDDLLRGLDERFINDLVSYIQSYDEAVTNNQIIFTASNKAFLANGWLLDDEIWVMRTPRDTGSSRLYYDEAERVTGGQN